MANQEALQSEYKKMLFRLGLKSYKSNKEYNISKAFTMMDLAISNIQSDDDYFRVLDEFDKYDKDDRKYNDIQLKKYNIILAKDGTQAAINYLENNLAIYSLFKLYLDYLISEDKVSEAIDRINYFLKFDIKRSSYDKSIVDSEQKLELNQKLLELYFIVKDNSNIVKTAEYLFSFTYDIKYATYIKDILSPAEWGDFVELYYDSINNKDLVYYSPSIPKLLAFDEQFDRLFEYLKQHTRIYDLKDIDKILFERFPDETAALYYRKMAEYLKDNRGYDSYRSICDYIERIIEIGYPTQASMIIDQLKLEFTRLSNLKPLLNAIVL
jgi:hypothetical protein